MRTSCPSKPANRWISHSCKLRIWVCRSYVLSQWGACQICWIFSDPLRWAMRRECYHAVWASEEHTGVSAISPGHIGSNTSEFIVHAKQQRRCEEAWKTFIDDVDDIMIDIEYQLWLRHTWTCVHSIDSNPVDPLLFPVNSHSAKRT